jgi:hypothetical protein
MVFPACRRASATNAPVTPAPTTATSTFLLAGKAVKGTRISPWRSQTGVPVRRSRFAVVCPAMRLRSWDTDAPG